MDTFILASFLVSTMLFPVYTDTYISPVEPPQLHIRAYTEKATIERFGGQWEYIDELIKRESGWNNLAQNPKSTAFGLFQMLNSTWKTVDCVKTSDPYIQIDCGINYVHDKYETPKQAINFHNRNGYY